MTPVTFVFLTFMFGVTIPTPTHGKMKITFREAMSMSRRDLETRQVGVPGESEAFRGFMNCLEKFRLGPGNKCDDGYLKDRMDEQTRKYADIQDIPLNDWLRIASLKCMNEFVCWKDLNICCTSDFVERARVNGGSFRSDTACGRFDRDSGVKCDKEYEAFQKFNPSPHPSLKPDSPRHTTIHSGTGRSRRVSASKSGLCFTVMASIAISGRHLSSS